MLLNSFYIFAGLILLVVGAESLVRGSVGLALRLGITTLVIGLTVVAFGTSSPELVLSAQAASSGNSGIALGNVVGSNISNIALVLGAAALVKPMHVRSELIRREVPLMIAITLLLVFMLLDDKLTRIEGVALVVGATAYTVVRYLAAKRGDRRVVAEEFEEGIEETLATPVRPAAVDAGLVLVGLAALVGGASLLLRGATFIASGFGISQVVIGLTVIAIGTSLPELATAVTAAIRGEADVAFGNVLGSNALNILAVLGIAAVIRPFEVEGLRTLDLIALTASAVAVLPLMWRGACLNRWEGALLVAGYGAYIYTLVP